MSNDKKKEADSTETTRQVQKEILQVLDNNEVTYDEAKKILSGMACAIKRLAFKQKIKTPY